MFRDQMICSCVAGIFASSVIGNASYASESIAADVQQQLYSNHVYGANSLGNRVQGYDPYSGHGEKQYIRREEKRFSPESGKDESYFWGYYDGYQAAYLQAQEHVLLQPKNKESQNVVEQSRGIDYSLIMAFDSP